MSHPVLELLKQRAAGRAEGSGAKAGLTQCVNVDDLTQSVEVEPMPDRPTLPRPKLPQDDKVLTPPANLDRARVPAGTLKREADAAGLEDEFRRRLYVLLSRKDVLGALEALLKNVKEPKVALGAWETVLKYGLLPKAESAGGGTRIALVNLIERAPAATASEGARTVSVEKTKGKD